MPSAPMWKRYKDLLERKIKHIQRALSFLLGLILLLSSNMFQCIKTERSVGENEIFMLEPAEYFERNCKNNSM